MGGTAKSVSLRDPSERARGSAETFVHDFDHLGGSMLVVRETAVADSAVSEVMAAGWPEPLRL